MNITRTKINKNYTVNQKVTSLEEIEEIPKKIEGSFYCDNNILVTLKGSPEEILGSMYCYNNKLKNLESNLIKVNGDFDCNNNDLVTLKGRPKEIKGMFVCNNNKNLKNVKKQIIENGIKATKYYTDEGWFLFKDIKEEFNKYQKYIIKKKEILDNLKNKSVDYGMGI